MTRLPKILGFFILIIVVLAFTIPAFAGHPCINSSKSITTENHLCLPNAATTIETILNAIVNFLFDYGMPIVVLFMVLAGFMFVTARGNEEQLTKAKTTLFWTMVGAAVIVSAKIIAEAVKSFGNQLS